MFRPRLPAALSVLILICLLVSLFTLLVFSEGDVGVSARSAALYEPTTATYIYEKNGDMRLPMASTTKIMTALVALENGNPDEVVTVPPEAVGIEGSSLYLREGEKITLGDLLYGLMLRSANDAATAIAVTVGGTQENFVRMMNEKAEELGLSDTHFENPHGLDAETHYTTAKELAALSAAAMENEKFRMLVSTRKKIIGEGDSARLIVNHNKMLLLYDGAVGVKTGFTKKSGRCLVSAAERDGVLLIAVTIAAPDDWRDHTRLLDEGFSRVERRTVAADGEMTFNVPVIGGTAERVPVHNVGDISFICPKDEVPYRTDVRLCRFTATPVKKGDILGSVLVFREEKLWKTVPLYAAEDVPEAKKESSFFGIFGK